MTAMGAARSVAVALTIADHTTYFSGVLCRGLWSWALFLLPSDLHCGGRAPPEPFAGSPAISVLVGFLFNEVGGFLHFAFNAYVILLIDSVNLIDRKARLGPSERRAWLLTGLLSQAPFAIDLGPRLITSS